MIFVGEGQFMKWMPGGESGDIEDRRDEGGGGGFHPLQTLQNLSSRFKYATASLKVFHAHFTPASNLATKLALATELGITYILLTFT
jgi:hypothetical protein